MKKKKIITGFLVIIVIAIVVFFLSQLSVSPKSTPPPFEQIPNTTSSTTVATTTSTSTNVATNTIEKIVEDISHIIEAIDPPPPTAPSSGLPRGVFSLISPNQNFDVSVNNPYVKGLALGGHWQDIEPASGQYNWSGVDQQVNSAISHGKFILLRIDSGGKNTPSWVMNEVSKFSFIDPNEYHSTYQEPVTIPVFWDPVFLEEKKKLIMDTGAHFVLSKIDIVSASCANGATNDWNTEAKTQTDYDNWVSLGFTPDKLIDACKQIIDTTASAFPNSFVVISIGSSALLDPSPNYISRAVTAYGSSKYPGRFITESNGLSAITPDPTLSGKPAAAPASFQDGHYTASQMLWFATGDPTCRMNGQKTPCDANTMLSKALTTGAHLGKLYIEVYAKDIANPALQGTLDAANKLMGV